MTSNRVRLIDILGRVSESSYEINEIDKNGYMIAFGDGLEWSKNQYGLENSGKKYRVHKKRILPLVAKPGSAVAIKVSGVFRAACPQCQNLVVLNSVSETADCIEHGNFEIYWDGEQKMSEEAKSDTAKKLMVTDCGQYGDIWTKCTVPFNHPKVIVRSHTLIIQCDDGKNRKLCFNSYNGFVGTKGIDFSAVKRGENSVDGKPLGIMIKSELADEHRKLEKGGYKRGTG